jgi:hypothetical protein
MSAERTDDPGLKKFQEYARSVIARPGCQETYKRLLLSGEAKELERRPGTTSRWVTRVLMNWTGSAPS